MKYSQKDLDKHLDEEHKINPLSEYLKEIVYGGNDGIITTFAVVAGFAGATGGGHIPIISFIAVLIFGLANLFADGISMGLGNFLSVHSDQDNYKTHKQKELHEIRTNPNMEAAETIQILKNKGYSQKKAEAMTKLYTQNEDYWLEFMMNQELEFPNPENTNPFLTGLATFFSFIFFGFIPLMPYVVLKSANNTFLYSSFSTLIALILLGLLRWRISKQSALRSVGEVVLVGGVSAITAFVVGSFFRA